MEKIIISKEPRTKQTVNIDGQFFTIGFDYSQQTDKWVFSIENQNTQRNLEGIEITPFRPLIFHHRNWIGMNGDIFALPTGTATSDVLSVSEVGWDSIISDEIELFFISAAEAGTVNG